jgi:hypothetical protein
MSRENPEGRGKAFDLPQISQILFVIFHRKHGIVGQQVLLDGRQVQKRGRGGLGALAVDPASPMDEHYCREFEVRSGLGGQREIAGEAVAVREGIGEG